MENLRERNKNAVDDEVQLPSVLRVLLELGGSFAVMLYAYSWIFIARFLDEFGLEPEEIGVTTQWLITRAASWLLPFLVFAIAYIGLSRLRQQFPLHLVQSGQILLLTAAVAGVLLWLIALKGGIELITSVVTVLFLMSTVLFVVSLDMWHLRATGRNLLALLFAILLMVITGVFQPWQMANEVAQDVREGWYGTLYTLPGVPTLRVAQVSVLKFNENVPPKPLEDDCARYLGSANGMAILLADPDYTVWRMSTQDISLRDGCSNDQVMESS